MSHLSQISQEPTPLGGVDGAWWLMNRETNLVIITALLRLRGSVGAEEIAALLEKGIGQHRRFRQRVRMRRVPWLLPFWEDDPTFAVATHVRRLDLPTPADEGQLQSIVGEIMSQPLPLDRPLWQATLIAESNGNTALVFRLHHCMADGISLVQFLLSLAEGEKALPVSRRGAGGNVWQAVGMALGFIPTGLASLLMPPDAPTVFKGRLGTTKRAAWSRPLDLAQIKALGQRTGGTVNDVLITLVVGALRHVLPTPPRGAMRASIAVNLRPPRETDLGNVIGIVFLPLPIQIEDFAERLARVQAEMGRLKRSPQAMVSFVVLWLAGWLPGFIAQWLAGLVSSKSSLVLTNVPGPQGQLSLAGHVLEQIVFWVPQAGDVALAVCLLSYNGAVTVGVATDAAVYAEPMAIVGAFEQELKATRP